MALAKKTLIIAIVGVVVLLAGIGAGVFFGLKFFSKEPIPEQEVVQQPGPMIDLGQFTVNLADPEQHIVRVKIAVELDSPLVQQALADPGWTTIMTNEVLNTLADQRYNNLRYSEGMAKLQQELRARLNAKLPRNQGKVAVRQVLFSEFMVQ